MAANKKQQKLVDELAIRVELCREFMNDWLLFNQVLTAYPSPGVNKAQLENQFLKIKSKLAREHQVLKDRLMQDYGLDGNTMNIVSGATNLEAIYSQSEVALKKLQGEWHRAFISINETLGTVEDKRMRAEAGEKVMITMPGQGPVKTGGGMDPKQMKVILLVVAIIAVFGAVIGLNIGGYRDMLMSFMP